MPEHDMEDIFREKLNDFAPSHGDRWEQIANALPPEKNRRRGMWIWFTGIGACIVLGLVGINHLPNQHLAEVPFKEPVDQRATIQEESSASAFTEHTGTSEIETIQKPKEDLGTRATKGQTEHFSNPSKHKTENKIPRTENNEGSRNEAPAQIIPPAPQPNTDPETDEPQEQATPEKKILDLETPPTLEIEDANANENPSEPLPIAIGTQPEPQPEPSHPERSRRAQTHPWSFGIGAGAFYSSFAQKLPKHPGNTDIEKQGMVERNRDLREAMEQRGSTFTQSIWVEYKPFEHWSFSTGISMLQTTQNSAFDVQNVFDDSIHGPQHFPEGGSISAGGQYIFINDSILPGNSVRASSKYFAREIPLYINYHYDLNEKFSLQASVGISYRWVRSASVYMADIDNIGIIRLDGPENYPGIRNTFQIQGGIGLNYRFNDYFMVQAMPSYSYSIQSNIRFSQYVQQYQRQWGLQLKLTRNLDF